MWAGWRLKQWGGGGAASGPLLEAYHNKWAITPCGEGAWSDYSSYPCPRVMKLSFPPLLCDHTGRLGIMTRGSHLHCRLLFPFLSFPLLSSPFLSPLFVPSPIPRTNPIPMLSPPSRQPYTTWTLGALSSNPLAVLSQLRNNSHRTGTAQSRSLQENSCAPTRLWDPPHPTASAKQPVTASH